jgi:DNA helicase HerA-like ATPase
MTTLNLGTVQRSTRAFRLPLDVVTSTIAILARKGRGKTYTAAVLCEEFLDAGQIPVIIDPLGVWWGLKSSAPAATPTGRSCGAGGAPA